jgi:adenosylcobinamide kinase/adenosylcobinamide-phosphate guanylyltransferase
MKWRRSKAREFPKDKPPFGLNGREEQSMKILVTGGARSGKSSFAERYVQKLGPTGLYIATAQPFDEEMKERLNHHRARRENSGYNWETIEEPLHLAELLRSLSRPAESASAAGECRPEIAATPATGSQMNSHSHHARPEEQKLSPGERVVLVDCLTIWLSNWVLHYESDPDLERLAERKADELAEAVQSFSGTLVLVTNEVGSGIVPEYRLGRVFRDAAGRLNQRIAQVCDQVILVACGIPVDLKKVAFRLD